MIVMIVAVIAIFRSMTDRVKSPTEDLKAEVSDLRKRVYELENKKNI